MMDSSWDQGMHLTVGQQRHGGLQSLASCAVLQSLHICRPLPDESTCQVRTEMPALGRYLVARHVAGGQTVVQGISG